MMNKTKRRLTTFLLAVAALSLIGCGSSKDSSADTTEQGAFSELTTTDLEGNKVDSSVFSENKLTFVNAWNVGCSPCVNELPVLNQLNEDYKDKGVAVKGLYYNFGEEISDELKEEIDAILSDAEASYQQLTISESMNENETIKSIMVFPTTFVVNSDGQIVKTIEGANDYEGWKEIIDKELTKVSAND